MADPGNLGGSENQEITAAPYAGLSPQLFDRLRAHLAESVAVVDADGRVRALLGPADGAVGLGAVVGRHIFEYLVPDDRPRSLELAVEALGSSPGWSQIWYVPLRDRLGEVRDFEVKIVNCQDDPDVDGFVLRLRRLPRRKPEQPLFASEFGTELETLAGAMPLPILLIGSDARLYYANDAAREICSDHLEELFQVGLGALAEGEDRRRLEGLVADLLGAPGERTLVFHHAHATHEEARVIEARMSALGRGRVLALVVTLVDVTARHLTESELRRLAVSDPLTGLPNRSAIEVCLRSRLENPTSRVGVCYLDLDGFKSVNDTHGHEVGDEVLVSIAEVIHGELAIGDEVGRFGGDEFVIVADVADGPALVRLAERVANAVAKRASALGHPVTASVGVGLNLPDDTPRDLIRRADQAMYAMKRLNRISAELP